MIPDLPLSILRWAMTLKYVSRSHFQDSVANRQSKVWPLYIESQQAILAATQFVIKMNQFVKNSEAHAAPVEQMQELHTRIDGLLAFAHGRTHTATVQVPSPEQTAAQALRCMSIVKLNRYADILQFMCTEWHLMTLVIVHESSSTDIAPSPIYPYSPNHTVISSRHPRTSTWASSRILRNG